MMLLNTSAEFVFSITTGLLPFVAVWFGMRRRAALVWWGLALGAASLVIWLASLPYLPDDPAYRGRTGTEGWNEVVLIGSFILYIPITWLGYGVGRWLGARRKAAS